MAYSTKEAAIEADSMTIATEEEAMVAAMEEGMQTGIHHHLPAIAAHKLGT